MFSECETIAHHYCVQRGRLAYSAIPFVARRGVVSDPGPLDCYWPLGLLVLFYAYRPCRAKINTQSDDLNFAPQP